MSQLKAGVGASDTLFQHERPNHPDRSRFNMSRITNFTLDSGMIVPFDWLFCLPGDDIDIDFEYILDTLPLVNPSLTSYKVLTHWYFIDCKKLWEGWQTFITRGRSGNINLQIPQLDCSYALANSLPAAASGIRYWKDSSGNYLSDENQPDSHIYAKGSHSLGAFLGNPSNYNGKCDGIQTESDGAFTITQSYLPYYSHPLPSSGKCTHDQSVAYQNLCNTGLTSYRYVSALPFMAYQNIVKYNYVNQNLLQNNHSLFPVKGDHDWFLPYNATITNWLDFPSNTAADAADPADKVFRFDGVYTDSDTATRLDLLRYAQFDDDYFTTGLPWLQRGGISDIPVDASDISLKIGEHTINIPSLNLGVSRFESGEFVKITGASFDSDNTVINSLKTESAAGSSASLPFRTGISTEAKTATVSAATIAHSSATNLLISVNQLREAIAMQVWQERNARVNGSYNSMIYQHWLSNPHAEEHKPDYIGGTADTIAFSTILQSSESTSDSPLGATAGRGSSGGSARVGRYHANDYGYLFGIMIIKPNTTYMQGIEHHLTEKVFDDFVQPEFEGLSPQPILNKELYISNNSSDEDLLCYQERYVYLKVRSNVNRGMFQCEPDKDRLFGSFTQARWFKSKPTFSYQFLCMSPDNIRRDWLAYPSMPAFKVQAASKIYVTRALSYTSQPNTFGF